MFNTSVHGKGKAFKQLQNSLESQSHRLPALSPWHSGSQLTWMKAIIVLLISPPSLSCNLLLLVDLFCLHCVPQWMLHNYQIKKMKECMHLSFSSANPHWAGLYNEGYGGNKDQVWTGMLSLLISKQLQFCLKTHSVFWIFLRYTVKCNYIFFIMYITMLFNF